MDGLPVIDISPLREGGESSEVAASIDAACREVGFFYVAGHGVSPDLRRRLDHHAREFFALDNAEKSGIAMARGGKAWRGWFPLGGELTSGAPDHKEGLYFGQELAADDPRVRAGIPLHGPNLFPERPAGLAPAVADYIEAVTEVGQVVLRGMALGLGLDPAWFERTLTTDPLVLFRIFCYPPVPGGEPGWGVAEHTDYGLLTILGQDDSGGLQVRTSSGWIEAPAVPDAFVVNLGDMLERMTAGHYRSTPHRVRNAGAGRRLSFPLFLDPGWDCEVPAVPRWGTETSTPGKRWDGGDVHAWEGTYGDYVLTKVSKVFPALVDDALGEGEGFSGSRRRP